MRPFDPAVDPPWSIRQSSNTVITPEHATALGYVTAYWSLLETLQHDFIKELLHLTGPVGYALTAEMTALQRMAAIRTLLYCTQRQDWLDDWDAISTKVRKLQAMRNDAVHAEWHNKKGTLFARRRKAKGTLQLLEFEFSTKELNELSEAIIDLEDEIFAFGLEVFDKEPSAYDILSKLHVMPKSPPIPNQSRKAQVQAEARARKKVCRDADRAASRKRSPKLDAP